MRKIIAPLFYSFSLFSSKIEFYDINESLFGVDKTGYRVEARYKLIDLSNLKKRYRYFNRKRVISRYYYIKDGEFYIGSFRFGFKKMFRVNNHLIFQGVSYKNMLSKECYMDTKKLNKLKCKNVKYYRNKRVVKSRLRVTYDTLNKTSIP